MSRRRKWLLALGIALALLCATVFLPPLGASHDGVGIDEWFRRYCAARLGTSTQPIASAEAAFKNMGIHAVPFLARRINRSQGYTRLSRARAKYHRLIPQFLAPILPLYPGEKFTQGMDAAELLATQVKPPGRVVVPLIAKALESTNANQRCIGFAALRGISSDYELVQPHLARGLKDPDSRVQRFAAMAIRWHGPHGRWAVTNLLETARTSNVDVLGFSLQALNSLGTNALPILPRLSEMLATETNQHRREMLSESIEYILNSRR